MSSIYFLKQYILGSLRNERGPIKGFSFRYEAP